MNNLIEAASYILGRELIYEKPLYIDAEDMLVEAYQLELEIEKSITESLIEAVVDDSGISKVAKKVIELIKKAYAYIVNLVRVVTTKCKEGIAKLKARKKKDEKHVLKKDTKGTVLLLTLNKASTTTSQTKVDKEDILLLDSQEVIKIIREKAKGASSEITKVIKWAYDNMASISNGGSGVAHIVKYDEKQVDSLSKYLGSIKFDFTDTNAAVIVRELDGVTEGIRKLNIQNMISTIDKIGKNNKLSDARLGSMKLMSSILLRVTSSTGKLGVSINKCITYLVNSVEIDVTRSDVKIIKSTDGEKNVKMIGEKNVKGIGEKNAD